jgi:hypothetical protein
MTLPLQEYYTMSKKTTTPRRMNEKRLNHRQHAPGSARHDCGNAGICSPRRPLSIVSHDVVWLAASVAEIFG